MLELLISVVNLVRTTLCYGFYLSYQTGYFLVTTIKTIVQYLQVVGINFISLISVVSDAFVVFFQDIFIITHQVILSLVATGDIITASIASLFLKLWSFMQSTVLLMSDIFNIFTNAIAVTIAALGQLVVLFKKLVVLFGAGIWFLITLIPFFIYYLCTLLIYFVQSIYNETCEICYSGMLSVKTLIKRAIYFILDVPLESFAGLIVAVSLAYIFGQFYILILSTFKQLYRKLKNWSRRQQREISTFFRFNVSLEEHTPMVRQPVYIPRHRPGVRQQINLIPRIQARTTVRNVERPLAKPESPKISDEKCCVICQERVKCILLLPCRHLCLCAECTRELRYYNAMCPICRTGIESTMKIFV